MGEDWHKPRSHGNRLTAEEIESLRRSYFAGEPYSAAARKLACSSRTACKYYRMWRADAGLPARRKARPQTTTEKPSRPSRFYKSNFELDEPSHA